MLIFFDVDCQKDFINKDGALYVPGAEEIKPALKKLTQFAVEHDILILGSVDRHFEDDDELKHFPPHCMNKTESQKKIPETLTGNTTYIESKIGQFGKYVDYTWDEIQIEIKNHNQIIFEKQHTDVFTNRNVVKFLNKLRVAEAIIYGVATEYCVKDAVLGFLKLEINVQVISDAIKGIDKNNTKKTIKEMKEKGVVFTTTKEYLEEKTNEMDNSRIQTSEQIEVNSL